MEVSLLLIAAAQFSLSPFVVDFRISIAVTLLLRRGILSGGRQHPFGCASLRRGHLPHENCVLLRRRRIYFPGDALGWA